MKYPTAESPDGKKYEERILTLRRVSKKTTGGNYISFSTLVAIGDGQGNVGIGIGRGLEVPPSIQKATTQAKKHMLNIPIFNDTIPHEVRVKFKSSILLLKPAPQGTGLKVGGVVRVILDLAGVNNASGKIIGTRNKITNAYAVMEALKMLKPRVAYKTKDAKAEPKKAEVAVTAETPVVKAEKTAKEAKPAKKEVTTEKKAVKKVAKKK
ncbi:MAG: ribosomal protein S5 [Weeksellaceae bacterium]